MRMEQILLDMAWLAKSDAAKLKAEAKKEIEAANAMLDALDPEQAVIG